MWKRLRRIIAAGGCLLAVWWLLFLPVQAQSGENYRTSLPLLARKAPVTAAPPANHYVGLVRYESQFYTLRGDSSEWTLLAEDAAEYSAWAWSPDGAYFVYNRARGDETEMWLVETAHGESRLIMAGEGIFLEWSPDSRRIAYFGMDKRLFVYDVANAQLHSYTLPEPYVALEKIHWSPDSRHLSWYDHLNQGGRLWVLPDGAAMARLVFTGAIQPHSREWSPDSTRLLFGVSPSQAAPTIYETDADGSPATPLLAGHGFTGWVEGGNRILTWRDGDYYLTSADGGTSTFFGTSGGYASISPTGNKVMYWSADGVVLQGTNTPGTFPLQGFEQCDYSSLRWRSDGEMVLCFYLYGTLIATSDPGAPQISDTLPWQVPAQFLPFSAHSIPLSEVFMDTSGEYPIIRFVKRRLFDYAHNVWTELSYPHDRQAPVLEWRYLP